MTRRTNFSLQTKTYSSVVAKEGISKSRPVDTRQMVEGKQAFKNIVLLAINYGEKTRMFKYVGESGQ